MDFPAYEFEPSPKRMNEIRMLKRAQLVPSETNPRKRFDEGKLAELAATIREHGILEPLVVRSSPDGPQRFEIVAGERRFRAAGIAGLEELPCIVKELADAQVLEIQYIENLQREDLSAIEEAEGFARLIESGAYTAESLAQKLGKSRSHVFSRLRLSRLQGFARAQIEEGAIAATIGSLAAQLPTERLQKKFLQECMKGTWRSNGEALSFRQAEELLEREYIRSLEKGCAFHNEKELVNLVKGAGACFTCPKRSGNLRGFESGNPNVCTDVECFDGKAKAAGELRVKQAEERGEKVVRVKNLNYDVERKFPKPGEKIYNGASGSKAYGKSYEQLLKKECPKVLVASPEGVSERVDVARAQALLEEKGLLARERKGKSEAEKKADLEAKIATAVTQRAIGEVAARLENPVRWEEIQDEFLRLLCEAFVDQEVQIYDSFERAAKRRGIEPAKTEWGGKEVGEPFERHFAALAPGGVRGLLAEFVLGVRGYDEMPIPEKQKVEGKLGYVSHLAEACALLKVNVRALEAAVRAEFAGSKDAKGKKKRDGKPDPERAEQAGIKGTFATAPPAELLSPAQREKLAEAARKWAAAKGLAGQAKGRAAA